jgi:hypothetical protein
MANSTAKYADNMGLQDFFSMEKSGLSHLYFTRKSLMLANHPA